jgi:D-alanine--poly(phosphoribitol) ligase subunit 2
MRATNAQREQVARLFAEALHLEVPAADADLFETGILDSLAFVELLLQLEQRFGVTASVDDLELENFKSVERIADFVASRSAAVLRIA